MRELLVTITLLSSVVSSEEFEPKKRLGIPPEEDPNFWPTRGRRSYWSNPHLIGNLIHRDLPQGPEVDYAGHAHTCGSENELLSTPGVMGLSDNWRVHLCPRKKPISLVLPLQEYRPDDGQGVENLGKCNGPARERDRRGDERWRRQQPLYVEEPGWVAINYDQGMLGGSMGEGDPFIVTRGKKRSEQILDLRERRQLEDVLSSYSTDPFFVARGKRSLRKEGVGRRSMEATENQSSKVSRANKFDSKLNKKTRSKKPGDEKGRKSEEGEVSSRKNSNFFINREKEIPGAWGDEETPFLTTPGLREGDVNPHPHPRSQRSTSDVFERDESKWIKSEAKPHKSSSSEEEFSVVKPRYSRPRDKHSNLQSILDEPFFVSRGKKTGEIGFKYLQYGGAGGLEDVKSPIEIIGEAPETPKEIFQNFNPEDPGLSIPSGGKTLYYEDLELLEKLFTDVFKRSKTDKKNPRNRRGMLDDLLKGDDPFYVARGKRRFYPQSRSQYFDLVINGLNENPPTQNANGKFSLFAKTTRTKLLQKLSEFSKNRVDNSEKDFWNVTNNAVNQIN